MKVFVRSSGKMGVKSKKINYLHVFTAEHATEEKGMATVTNSLVRIGRADRYFTGKGENIFLGSNPKSYELEDVYKWIVESVFEDFIYDEKVIVHD